MNQEKKRDSSVEIQVRSNYSNRLNVQGEERVRVYEADSDARVMKRG